MTLLKSMLMKKAGLVRDSLTASKLYVPCQGPQEKVAEFLTGLKQLFKEVHPTEQLTSAILLQRFFTGLSPKIYQQLLLCGIPETLHQAVDDATAIEYALNFEQERMIYTKFPQFTISSNPRVLKVPKSCKVPLMR